MGSSHVMVKASSSTKPTIRRQGICADAATGAAVIAQPQHRHCVMADDVQIAVLPLEYPETTVIAREHEAGDLTPAGAGIDRTSSVAGNPACREDVIVDPVPVQIDRRDESVARLEIPQRFADPAQLVPEFGDMGLRRLGWRLVRAR